MKPIIYCPHCHGTGGMTIVYAEGETRARVHYTCVWCEGKLFVDQETFDQYKKAMYRDDPLFITNLNTTNPNMYRYN